MTISSLNLLVIKPTSGQTSTPATSSVPIPTPSVPQFTIKLVNTSDLPTIYWLNLNPESTISIPTDNNTNYTLSTLTPYQSVSINIKILPDYQSEEPNLQGTNVTLVWSNMP